MDGCTSTGGCMEGWLWDGGGMGWVRFIGGGGWVAD